jgi:PAS domain S-box-containing protein
MEKVISLLHLEDDVQDAELVQAMLEAAGLDGRITHAQTRDEFCEALQAGGYDVILADYRLPSYDGISALRLAQAVCPEIPFIFVSGTLGEDAAIEGLTQGATDYVLKQKLTRLVPAVKRALREAENQQERSRAELSLRESEARFRQLAEAIHEVFWLCEVATGQMLYVSPAYETVWGHTSDLRQQPCPLVDSVHPDDLARVHNAQQILLEHAQSLDEEYRIVRPDGTVRWVRTRSFPIRGEAGQIYRQAGIVEDITARKRADETLHLLNAAMQQATEAMVITTAMVPQGKSPPILYTNPAFTQLTGYAPEEAAGQTMKLLQGLPTDGATLARMVASIGQGESFQGELICQRKDGTNFWMEMHIAPVLSATGERTHFVAVLHDVTARKQAEEAIRCLAQFPHENPAPVLRAAPSGLLLYANPSSQPLLSLWQRTVGQCLPLDLCQIVSTALASGERQETEVECHPVTYSLTFAPVIDMGYVNIYGYNITRRKQAEEALEASRAVLAQRVEERTLELRAANVALGRAMHAKDDFLAGMSHELRAPLTGILGLSEALQIGVYGPLTEAQLDSLKNIHDSGQHLLSLITDILDLSKIEAGKMELQLGPVSVAEVCQASLRFVTVQASKKRLHVSYTLDQMVTSLRADERRLRQMLINLLSNAIKFTPEGGQIGLEVIGDAKEQVVQFAVWDTGIGIHREDMAQLFQPFTQLDSLLTGGNEGTGLGLTLVRRMAERHGGSVAVQSDGVPGQGSRFTISLPWNMATNAPLPAKHRQPTGGDQPRANGEQALVLLAEDNQIAQTVLADFLGSQAYRVVLASNGVEALEKAADMRPGLILMDIRMPEMNGLDAIRSLRRIPDLSTTRIVALTALAMPGDRERCLAAGANDYLVKPVSLMKLAQTLEAWRPRQRVGTAQTPPNSSNPAPGQQTGRGSA